MHTWWLQTTSLILNSQFALNKSLPARIYEQSFHNALQVLSAILQSESSEFLRHVHINLVGKAPHYLAQWLSRLEARPRIITNIEKGLTSRLVEQLTVTMLAVEPNHLEFFSEVARRLFPHLEQSRHLHISFHDSKPLAQYSSITVTTDAMQA